MVVHSLILVFMTPLVQVGQHTLFRWTFTISFCVAMIAMNACGWGFASVAKSAEIYYDVHINLINVMTMSGFVLSCITYVMAMYIADRFPVVVSSIIAVILGLGGCWMKYAAGHRFWISFAGQMISCMACPFLNSAPAAVAKEFFEPSKRASVTALGTLSQLIGMGAGLALVPIFKDNLLAWLWLQSCAISISAILVCLHLIVFFFWRRYTQLTYIEPRHPLDSPSEATSIVKVAYWKSVTMLLKNKNFLRLLIGFSMVVGTVNALLTLCDQVGPESILKHHAGGILGGLFFGAGSVGAVIVSIQLDKSRNYLQVIRFISIALIPLFTATFTCWELDCYDGIPIYIGMGSMGFFGIPLFPLAIELGIELSYIPNLHQEGIVNGLIQNTQNIFGVLITICTTPAISGLSSKQVPVIWSLLMFSGLYLMATVEPDYRRLHRELSRVREPLLLSF